MPEPNHTDNHPLYPDWPLSRYSGLFREHGAVPLRPHDPWVPIWSGTVAHRDPAGRDRSGAALQVGGAGFTEQAARLAGIGEAIERWQTHRLSQDRIVRASFAAWPLAEPAIAPSRWVLFHPAQYDQQGFPFAPIDATSELDWVCFRQARTGEPRWVLADLAFMDLRPGTMPRIAPAISTGWSAHQDPALALVRGVQEIIERDALVSGWWGRYAVREHEAGRIWAMLPGWIRARANRNNLCYRFYHIDSPYSRHVTMVTVMGDDREGVCFSIGSACRANRVASWQKALLEAIQGRHYVRYWKPILARERSEHSLASTGCRPAPASFRDHAMWYSLAPDDLAATVLENADRVDRDGDAGADIAEPLGVLIDRLGNERPVLFRNMIPPALAARVQQLGWIVVRVMVPGLQPLHGDHRLPFLGGSSWGDRPLADWADMPPHPFA